MDRPTLAALVLGLVLVVAGVALVHVPTSLIVAGAALLAYGLTRPVSDKRPDSKESRR